MARQFTAANNQWIWSSQSVITAVPLTISCWFKSTSITTDQQLCIIKQSGASHYWRLGAMGAVAGDPIRFACAAGGTEAVASTTPSPGYTANVWYHACGVATSATDRAVFSNGAKKGTSVTSRAPTGINEIMAGGWGTTPLDGRIAHLCIFNTNLTDAQVAQLANGVSPYHVRPDKVVLYWPMIGAGSTEVDISGGTIITLTEQGSGGTSWLADPPITYPFPFNDDYELYGAVTAAAPTAFPHHYYAQQRAA